MPPAIEVARRYAEAVAVLHALHDFDAWIGQYWVEPCSAATSTFATRSWVGAEEAIVWHESEDTVFGFLPGCDGCFCIPRDAALPHFPFATEGTTREYGQDIVISAAMREEWHSPGT